MNPETTSTPEIRLTQYSHGAGCGCKIAPGVLDKILHSNLPQPNYENLLVGNGSRDDAAVYRLPGPDGQCVISTTDFFMPIVDDAFDFGRIASANAISDVYAMGGRPLLAIAVLGWPIDKLAPEVAARVTEGARAICAEAGIPLAGGHSIDSPEPIFGLAVTGLVNESNLKRNDTATAGSRLYLTKPLGVGILSTAQKRGLLSPADADVAPAQMRQLNKIGAELGAIAGITAMTDVTGFGLLGHLAEVCEGSRLQAVIDYSRVPRIAAADTYLQQGAVPGGTIRNFQSYGHKVSELTAEQKHYLCDPQTSGGLLVCVTPGPAEDEARALFARHGLVLESFGELRAYVAGEPWIVVE
ncbi:selenide, water dikinase SelD [Hymenobacter sp. ASUV-10]|uniref:Selenide, water dikinase n=1 Tax=Hymenobacter aranciens TaxID=3063996 RepID=A0ABT9BJC1_9BACT|nr:selenide, water dikinase SelD [Hymenobacter sp. ASUV-10]MDO7877107.1 selenide, water dikinase SelD [Hymenobacter sp. ASUV-10]